MPALKPSIGLKYDPKRVAFAYQQEAIETIRDMEYAAVFHEQGLGKTKIALDTVLFWLSEQRVDTVIILTKKSLLENWRREVKMHTHLTSTLLTQSKKQNFYIFNSEARIILAHYELMLSEESRVELFLKCRDVGVILDESVKIKNPSAGITKCLHRLATLFKRRIIMTGTPVANRPYDLWAQIWFLDQGRSLGNDFSKFKRDLDLTSELADSEEQQHVFERELDGIYDKISAFTVRETKRSGIISLPEKIIHSVESEWEPVQYDLYRQYRDTLGAVILRDGVPSADNAESILKRLLRLVQIASNPALVDQSYRNEPGKLPVVVDLVNRIRDRGEKCIVWSSFNENVDWLTKVFKQHGARRIHGGLRIDQRNRSLDLFMNDCKTGVLVATPGAAKEGLTLTVANHVIFYDRGFSLDDYLQAQDRIHRISQEQTCHVYNLMLSESIDEWIDVLLRSKHLAAQLAQHDISLETYRAEMTYDFAQILRGILGIEKD